MEQLLNGLAQYGPFAILFGLLLKYVLETNEKREIAYQETIKANQGIISKLSETINLDLTSMKEDIKEIKERI